MSIISDKIKEVFADYSICKDKSAYSLFDGRNLPTFVKDYILNRFSDGEIRDEAAIKEYLAAKMPQNTDSIMMRLLDGDAINITTRIVVKTQLEEGKVSFMLPDLNISSKMYISNNVLEESRN
jgi:ATP-dependent Lon protease